MPKLRTHNRRARRKLEGRRLPPSDLRLFRLCNRFAASDPARFMLVGRDGRGALYFRDLFYEVKDRILHAFGRPAGFALQHWTSAGYVPWGDYGETARDACHHYHVLARTRLAGRVYHKPTGHFSWANHLSEDYKRTAGFDEAAAACVERLEGKKRVTRDVPDRAEAFAALRRLVRRYWRLPVPPPGPKPRVLAGNHEEEAWARRIAREREERARRRVQCKWCLETFSGAEVSTVGGHELCNACRSRALAEGAVEEEIPF